MIKKDSEPKNIEITKIQTGHCALDDGVITPSQVVAAAAVETHSLHHRFTWDDSEAAALWREQEARQLIRHVCVEITTHTVTIKAPMYVHDPKKQAQCYRNTELIAQSDPKEARRILAYAINTAKGHLKRAETLAAAFHLLGEVRSLVVRLDALESRLSYDEADRPH
jgi:hypothetical protein